MNTINSWLKRGAIMMFGGSSWLRRSGYAKSTSSSGLFYYSNLAGGAHSGISFRPVVLVGQGL